MPGSLVSATESSWTSTVLTLRFLPFKQLAQTYAVDNRLQGRESSANANANTTYIWASGNENSNLPYVEDELRALA